MNRLCFSLVLIAILSGPAHGTTFDSFSANREGLKKFEAKSYGPAYKEFLRALESDPLNPEVQMNLGRTFEANEEFDKAEKAYKGALQILPQNSPLRFEVLFNLGGVVAKLKRQDEALGFYQQALELNPQSIEVKTNIELMWQGGGGGGEGDQKDDKKDDKGENKDQKQDQKPDDQKDGEQKPQPKPKPKPFESKDLSKEDVKRILDEIKNQEQNIRAQEYENGAKEAPVGKDW